MITPNGYSTDSTIQPEGLVITFGAEMVKRNTLRGLLLWFHRIMEDESQFVLHRSPVKPKVDPLHVYIIINGRLYGRGMYAGFVKNYKYPMYGNPNYVGWTGLLVTGPFEKCPSKIPLKGFRGFRYCTKLF